MVVVGGVAGGRAASCFLGRAGRGGTLVEQEKALGGVVRRVIPEFRSASEAIDRDVELVSAMGVRMVTGQEITDVAALREAYDAVVLAVGAYEKGSLRLEAGVAVNALDFLAEFKATDGHADLGEQVVVIGGGNTAMDTARAAKRNAGVKKVSLVYRRTRRYMPADEEELLMALEDGVEFAELLAPISLSEGRLLCRRMALGAADAGGRRGVVETEETVELPADTVLAAVGARAPGGCSRKQGSAGDEEGRPPVNREAAGSAVSGLSIAGEGR